MKLTSSETFAIEVALEERILGLQNDIAKWQGEPVIEDCKALLEAAQSALEKIKSTSPVKKEGGYLT